MTTKMEQGKGSLSAIAAARGVSLMTVSRALRGDARVKEATRKEILETARAMGYYRDPRMGRPRAAETKTRPVVDVILGLMSENQPLFFSGLLLSVERELTGRGRDCSVRVCGPDYEDFLALTEVLRQTDREAALLAGYFPMDRLRGLLGLLPNALLVDNPGGPELASPYGFVAFDNVEAARIGVRHLLEQGRRRILLVKGPGDHYFSREIEQGYRETLAGAGLSPDARLILETDFSAEGAREATLKALDENVDFDGAFTNDEMAGGVLQALSARGVRVPENVSVVGCDGLPVGRQLCPRLTTVSLDYRELGRLAVETLLADPKPKRPLARIRLVPELEIRDSSDVRRSEG